MSGPSCSLEYATSILQLHGIGGLAGWRWLLLCEGLPACALGLYTLYALPDRARDERWLTDQQKDALEKRLSEESNPRASHNVWAALRDPRVLILTFSYFCLIVGVLGVALWLPQMLRQRGLSTTAIGFTAIFSLLSRFLQGAAAAASMEFVNSVGNLGGFSGPI